MPEFNDSYPNPEDNNLAGIPEDIPPFYGLDDETLAADADMLPTGNTDDSGDLEDMAGSPAERRESVHRYTTEPRPEMPPLDGRLPEREYIEQTHRPDFMSSEVVTGTHPNRRVARHIGKLIKEQVDGQDRLAEILTDVPNDNSRYATEREQLAVIAHEAYGIDPPITVLTEDQLAHLRVYYPFAKLGGKDDMVFRGHVLITPRQALLEKYGPEYLVAEGIHALGHAADPDRLVIKTAEIAPDGYVPPDAVKGSWGWKHTLYTGTGKGFLDPIGRDYRGDQRSVGAMWEEGHIDARRVRTQEERGIGLPNAHLGKKRGVYIGADTFVTMTEPGMGTPLLSGRTDEIAVPWKYAYAVRTHSGEPQDILLPTAGLAAYAVDLLEQHALPGLREQMDEAARTQDPGMRAAVEARINSVSDILYDGVSYHNYSTRDFMYGLRQVIFALDIDNRRV